MSPDIQKAVKARVVMLSGDEEALRLGALGDLLEAAGTDDDAYDREVMDAGNSSAVEWLASSGTAPFLSERRTVVVRHLLRNDGTEGLGAASLKLLPPSSLLVLVADDEVGDDARQRRLATLRRVYEKAVLAGGGVVLEFKWDAKQAKDKIKAEAARAGKKLSDRAAESLAEMTGDNLSRALGELEKLILFVGEGEVIGEAEIRQVVIPSREWNVYKLVDAVSAGQVAEALRQLRVLVGSSTKAEDAAFQRILPSLSRQFRLLWQARACIEAGTTPAAAPADVVRLFPDKGSLAKEPEYRIGRVMGTARRMSFPALEACLQELSDADCRLKGMLPQFSAIETLEQMVLRMVERVRPLSPTRK